MQVVCADDHFLEWDTGICTPCIFVCDVNIPVIEQCQTFCRGRRSAVCESSTAPLPTSHVGSDNTTTAPLLAGISIIQTAITVISLILCLVILGLVVDILMRKQKRIHRQLLTTEVNEILDDKIISETNDLVDADSGFTSQMSLSVQESAPLKRRNETVLDMSDPGLLKGFLVEESIQPVLSANHVTALSPADDVLNIEDSTSSGGDCVDSVMDLDLRSSVSLKGDLVQIAEDHSGQQWISHTHSDSTLSVSDSILKVFSAIEVMKSEYPWITMVYLQNERVIVVIDTTSGPDIDEASHCIIDRIPRHLCRFLYITE